MLTPSDVLSRLLEDDPSRPILTYYDDTPGDTSGERIEISRKVLGTWVAKAANALQEGLDCEPGTVVLLDIPAPHWRLVYWSFAVWSVGATLTFDPSEGADILITTSPDSPAVQDADEVIAVSLPGLAREFVGSLRTGVMDEARELASYGDSFTAWDEPEGSDAALVSSRGRTAYERVVAVAQSQVAGESAGSRLLITSTDPATFISAVLGCCAHLGSVVLVRGSSPRLSDARMRSEGVDAQLGAAH